MFRTTNTARVAKSGNHARKHARDRMAQRRVSEEDVLRALNNYVDEYGVAVGIEVLRLMRPTLTRFVYQVRSGVGTAVTQPAGVPTLS